MPFSVVKNAWLQLLHAHQHCWGATLLHYAKEMSLPLQSAFVQTPWFHARGSFCNLVHPAAVHGTFSSRSWSYTWVFHL